MPRSGSTSNSSVSKKKNVQTVPGHIPYDNDPYPVRHHDGKWWFWDETWSQEFGPYDTEEKAVRSLSRYCRKYLGIDVNKITPYNWQQMHTVRRKPYFAHAAQINDHGGFWVKTEHGKKYGKNGDYLVIEPDGNRTVVDRETFEKEYEILENDQPSI